MESILIDGVRYTIEHTTERIIVDGKECGGECDYDKCRIRISDARKKRKKGAGGLTMAKNKTGR